MLCMKMIETVATRWQILRLSAQNSILAGALPQTPLGELTALPDSIKFCYSSNRGCFVAVFRSLFVCMLGLRKNWFVIFVCSFGHLFLTKMIEIVATRWQILRLKCTKFDVGWGSAPDPAGGAYSAPPDLLAGF